MQSYIKYDTWRGAINGYFTARQTFHLLATHISTNNVHSHDSWRANEARRVHTVPRTARRIALEGLGLKQTRTKSSQITSSFIWQSKILQQTKAIWEPIIVSRWALVCSESRHEYLKTWKVLSTKNCVSSNGGVATIYFAHHRDTIVSKAFK